MNLRLSIHIAAISLLIACCKTELPEKKTLPEVPDTYAFENVNYSGQTDRLDQLDALNAYMESAPKEAVVLEVDALRDMFANTNGNGNGLFDFTSDRQLKNKCFEPDLNKIDGWFVALAGASASTTDASNGMAGIMTDAAGENPRLFDSAGMEYSQIIQKTLMGSVFYYQALNTYLSAEGLNVDNTTVEPGEGTAMQHHWDEAFGYFGAPVDFPENTVDARYWAKYATRREALLGTATDLSYAFRMGRAAIDAQDYDTRDMASQVISEKWELVIASTAISYLNSAVDDITNDHSRNHSLSECIGFVHSLLYNPDRKMTQEQINTVLGYIGENLYDVEAANLVAARNLISDVYNLNDVKEQL